MSIINIYKTKEGFANIDQLPLQRDWMDETFDRHSYHCFPMTLANRVGWGISFPTDISFIWDGINDSTSDHVRIITGQEYVHTKRGNRTISFNTGLIFNTKENISLLTMPTPNQFIDGAQCISTIISTSVLVGELPIAWMITRANEIITIPANTPIATIFPISLTDLQSYEVVVKSGVPEFMTQKDWMAYMAERGRVSQEKNTAGEWTHFYRDAVDHLGNKTGKHETKKIILKVYDETNN